MLNRKLELEFFFSNKMLKDYVMYCCQIIFTNYSHPLFKASNRLDDMGLKRLNHIVTISHT